jgi:dTDP-4-dehydrorhamnose reductase
MKVLVTGAGGQLGADLVCAFGGVVPTGGRRRSLYGPEGPGPSAGEVIGTDHATMPVEDRDAVLATVMSVRPQLIVHAAAYTAVDACESEPATAFSVNALGTRHLAEAAEAVGAHLAYISTDYVFDGRSPHPYSEWDRPNPLSVYGKSKLAGERECRPGTTIVRTSWVCGAHGANMVKTALRLAAGDGPLRFVDDQHGSPTFTADLAAAVVTLATDRVPGVFHVTNQGSTTWFELVRSVLAAVGADPSRVEPITTAELSPARPAPRPANSVLENRALKMSGRPLLPDWHDGLTRLVDALGVAVEPS